jgi:hypothetical protein
MAIRLACSTICFRTEPIEVALREIEALGFETLGLATVTGFCDHFEIERPGPERDAFVATVLASGMRVRTLPRFPATSTLREPTPTASWRGLRPISSWRRRSTRPR